jgi:hypothetical protein
MWVNLLGAGQSGFFRMTCFGYSFILIDTIILPSQLIVGRCKTLGSRSVRVSFLSEFRYDVVKTPMCSATEDTKSTSHTGIYTLTYITQL